jgi:uncharacterized protein (DUF58 family)
MKTRTIFILFISLLFFILFIFTGFVLLWRLFIFSLLIILFSFIYLLLAKRSIHVQTTGLSERCRAGLWIEQRVIISNNGSLFYVPVTVNSQNDMPGRHDSLKIALGSQQSVQKELKLYCLQRGRYKAGMVSVTVTDLLGLFSSTGLFGTQQNIIVYPVVYELSQFSPFSHDDYLMRARRWIGSGISSLASRVREYVSGDNLNHIHWRSTAHSGQLMVKVFDPDRSTMVSGSVWIIVDMEKKVKLGVGNDSTEEYGVTIAASLLKRYIDLGTPVGLIASGNKSFIVPPGIGDIHLSYLMELLTEIRSEGNTPIETVISNSQTSLGTNSTVIVITPSCNSSTADALKHSFNRGNTVLAILMDPSSFGGRGDISECTRKLLSGGAQVYTVSYGTSLELSLDNLLLMRGPGMLEV